MSNTFRVLASGPWFRRAANSWRRTYGLCWLGLFVALGLVARSPANDAVNAYAFSGAPDKQVKDNLERRALLQIERIRALCELSTDQVEHLRRAAMGDVARLFQDVSAIRHATEHRNMTDMKERQLILELVRPLSVRINGGLHGNDSLFAKVLEQTLDESQKARYRQFIADRAQQRNHLLTLTVVAAIDERVPLLKKQRERLVELIDSQPVPKIVGDQLPQLGYLRLANVPEQELQKFLDAEQVQFITKICEPYRLIGQAMR